ncbi:DUF2156 domain-containing protein [Treponema sp. C6A8]|uniref:DUF2156 domain-containing protein n=1 Tax=Treponema sp. C6A8 TaxID=1410609 RepID=UPI000481551F|nr:phosphatidylglycerol lysyltransferase domain-containing protein [Treponema sp. C6A8]
MLDFKPLLLSTKPLLDPFFFQYGEGSCQHSFAAAYCLQEKYGNLYAVKNDFLFILRQNRCNENEEVYLFPLGNIKDGKKALETLLSEAHKKGKKLVFETVTEKAKNFIEENYPEQFYIEEKRDNAEYIFNREKLAELKGKEYEGKRWEVHRFQKEFEGRYSIEELVPSYFEEVKAFSRRWYDDFYTEETNAQLRAEEKALDNALENFYELGFHGLVILIDSKIAAFEYGTPLNQDTYDGFVEKADRSYKYIYKMLNNTVADRCPGSIKWLNWEEDLGHEGLRKMKLSYRPEYLLKKYLVKEKD